MNIKWLSIVIIIGLVVPSCRGYKSQLYTGTDDNPWWNDVVFYEIFVRSFYDSDGDGIGDLNGVIEKLDYLNDGNPDTKTDLGITGIWLMPIFPSVSYHGYDVTDYYNINPEFGTMEDFERLLDEAHQRGIHVVVDLVINHTSNKHPWFLESSQDPDSKYRDWYIWSDENPGYRGPDGQKVWHPSGDSFYYGLFSSSMPDLNFENPEVTSEINEITRFWLEDVGVDGFRLDAAKHLIEKGPLQEHSSASHAWFKDYRVFYKGINPQAVVVAEVFETNTKLVRPYVEDELDLAFMFGYALKMIDSARSELALPAWAEMIKVDKEFPNRQYGTFLANHDQNRVMSQIGNDFNKAKVAASMLMTSPGVPFIYYGEEIGMLGKKPDEDIRRPMQWSGEAGAGFTTGTPWREPDPQFKEVNVIGQDSDPDSLLNHYRALIDFRQTHPALRLGEFVTVTTVQAKLFANLRTYQDQTLIVVINTSGEAVSDYRIAVDETSLLPGKYRLNSVFGPEVELPVDVDEVGGFNLVPDFPIPAYETLIFEVVPEN
jgi:glycosidase